jgi:hypothetical protein
MYKKLVYILTAVLTLNTAVAQSQSTNKIVIPAVLKQRYPNAEFQIVSVQEYQKLRKNNYPSYSANTLEPILVASQQQSPGLKAPSKEDSNSCELDCEDEEKPVGNSGGGGAARFLGDFLGSLGSTPEGVVIVLVVAGVVLVGALVFYAGVYLYELVKGKFEPPSWWEVRAGLDQVTADKVRGVLSSLRFKTAIPKSFLGLALETGYYHLFVTRSEGVEEQPYGTYWLAGPFVEFSDKSELDDGFSYGSFEFLAGKSLNSKIGVMSKIKFALNFKVFKSAVIGVNVGGLYTDLKYTRGLFDSLDEFSWLIGVDAGVRF